MIGSYFQTETLQAIGDATAPAGNNEAARALLELFPSLPGNRYTVWAKQIGEAQWADKSSQSDYLAVPVTARQLEEAENLAGGHAVGFVAIALPRPMPLAHAESLLRGTPYEPMSILVMYRQDDLKPVPTPVHFVMGRLRDQAVRPGTYRGLEHRAASVGGTLMALYSAPRKRDGRPRPVFRAESVIVGAPKPPQHRVVPTPRKAPMVVTQPVGGIGDSVMTWGAVGALAAVGLLALAPRLLRGRKR